MSACGWTAVFTTCPKRSKLDKNKKHTIEIVVDRLMVKRGINRRLTGFSIETAMPCALPAGLGDQSIVPGGRRAGTDCFRRTTPAKTAAFPSKRLTPRMFSFNNPYGACPTCSGLGTQLRVDPDAGRAGQQPFRSRRGIAGVPAGTVRGGRSRRTACFLKRWRRNTISRLIRRSGTCPKRRQK